VELQDLNGLCLALTLYGGTEALFAKTLGGLSIGAMGFADGIDETTVRLAANDALRKGRVAMIFTNGLVHIAMVRHVAEMISQTQGHTPIVACDNTLLRPVFQRRSHTARIFRCTR
jgi:methionine-gamma-lyase